MASSYYISLEIFSPKENIPNNPELPLLHYKQVFRQAEDLESQFKEHFKKHQWGGSWINGVYDYHHYHSNAHEVLGVLSGRATLIFGGPGGQQLEVIAGDAVVIPAGLGHCCLKASDDFKVIGAYPQGQEAYDLCTGEDDPEKKLQNIKAVPLPSADPIQGEKGPLTVEWF